MKNKKLTALILCFTMLFSITSGIFSAAFASDSTTGSAYSLDTTTGSAYKVEKGPMLFSTKAATTTPSASAYESNIGKIAIFNEKYEENSFFSVLELEPTSSWHQDLLSFSKTDFLKMLNLKLPHV